MARGSPLGAGTWAARPWAGFGAQAAFPGSCCPLGLVQVTPPASRGTTFPREAGKSGPSFVPPRRVHEGFWLLTALSAGRVSPRCPPQKPALRTGTGGSVQSWGRVSQSDIGVAVLQ